MMMMMMAHSRRNGPSSPIADVVVVVVTADAAAAATDVDVDSHYAEQIFINCIFFLSTQRTIPSQLRALRDGLHTQTHTQDRLTNFVRSECAHAFEASRIET